MSNNFRELIEITNDIRELDNMFENDDIDDVTYNDTKELILASIDKNVDGLVFYNTSLQSKIDECDIHLNRIKQYKKYLETKQNRLEKFLTEVMTTMDEKVIYGNISEIRKSKSTFIDVFNSSELPEEYTKQKIEITPDKAKIKEAIKNGIVVPGACISEKHSIRIK